MKKTAQIGIALGMLMLLVMTIGNTACGKAEAIDVVNHQSPVSDLYGRIRHDLEQMRTMPPEERATYLRTNWPNLEVGVVNFLRQREKIQPNQSIDRVDFRFGSMKNVRADGGDGQTREGYFNDQIVALVYVRGSTRPLAVIVQCLNGVYVLPEDLDAQNMQHIGSYRPVERFTIGYREGLIHHVDFPTAIVLAEQHQLDLYRTQVMSDRNKITPAQARALESRTDWIQVTVRVYEGDTFDLRTREFIPSRRRPRS